ncbi:hypothetical protein [Arsenophonus apicola]|uniref:hypothetical protein n=1 Tax=Arsenophonus apicola TaxID=2879119 RepID=UPI00387A78E8
MKLLCYLFANILILAFNLISEANAGNKPVECYDTKVDNLSPIEEKTKIEWLIENCELKRSEAVNNRLKILNGMINGAKNITNSQAN